MSNIKSNKIGAGSFLESRKDLSVMIFQKKTLIKLKIEILVDF